MKKAEKEETVTWKKRKKARKRKKGLKLKEEALTWKKKGERKRPRLLNANLHKRALNNGTASTFYQNIILLFVYCFFD